MVWPEGGVGVALLSRSMENTTVPGSPFSYRGTAPSGTRMRAPPGELDGGLLIGIHGTASVIGGALGNREVGIAVIVHTAAGGIGHPDTAGCANRGGDGPRVRVVAHV